MSGSDWRRDFPFIEWSVIALGFVLYCAMFYSAGGLDAGNNARAERYAAQYKADAPQRVQRECARKVGADLAKCAVEIVDASREQQHSESDLAAQWQAANWVLWATIIGAIQLVFSGLGLIALLRTIHQGREGLQAAKDAISETKRIGEAQTRCYLSGASAKMGYLTTGEFWVECLIRNTGQSPARNVKCSCEPSIFYGKTLIRGAAKKVYNSRRDIAAGGEEEFIIGTFVLPLDEAILAAIDGEGLLFAIDVSVNGNDVFDAPISEELYFSHVILTQPALKSIWDVKPSARHSAT